MDHQILVKARKKEDSVITGGNAKWSQCFKDNFSLLYKTKHSEEQSCF